MATMKIPYNGEWAVVNDPQAERCIFKTNTEPENAVEGALWIDTTLSSEIPLNNIGSSAIISLYVDNWTNGELLNEYLHNITINGITANSKVDLMPDNNMLSLIYSQNISLFITNNDGNLVCHCLGGKPSSDITIPVAFYDIVKDEDTVIVGNSIGQIGIQWDHWE